MKNVLNNLQRSKNAIICFYIILAAYSLMLISDFMEYQLLSSGSFGYMEANANDQRQLAVTVLALIAQIVLIVLFIQWFRRAYHNLHKAGVKGLNMTEGWAAGAWFVPILNLFKPYQIMKDIWVQTRAYISRSKNTEEVDLENSYDKNTSESTLALVGWWWGTWIVSSISANISAQIIRNAYTMDQFLNASILGLVSDVVGIACAIIAIKMIKESQKDQDQFLLVWKEGESADGFGISDSDDILD